MFSSTQAAESHQINRPMMVVASSSSGASPIGSDDMLMSWNTTPTSSLGAASPLDSTNGSLRQSAVASCFCNAPSSDPSAACVMSTGATMEEGGKQPNIISSPTTEAPSNICTTVPPSPASISPIHCVSSMMAHEAAAPGHHSLGAVASVRSLHCENNSRHNSSMVSDAGSLPLMCEDDDDEVVGVTADGELLFRKRDGADHYYEQRPLSRHHNSRAPPSPHRSAVPTLRPTPHRTQPRPTATNTPSSVTSSACQPQQVRAMSPPPAATEDSVQRADRQLFAEVPSVFETPVVQLQQSQRSVHRPRSTTMDATVGGASQIDDGFHSLHDSDMMPSSSVIALSLEELRFAQLSMRVRDRENDVYAQHVHDDFANLCRVHEQHERQLLNERFHRMAWDLRRF
ncbi:Hypothetical protein, putative [Bodo saltans]|uniref:Uncharacterized protein n=1 Tax=Bodo saltans TaxID=75058 RepID=A0A0S4J1X2_BODSA|nr:Hypothetical protein, putative [Bodo saltans]|eukprot:CUG14777.1 Hypothetical protein, putative [Bodo saltans]